MLHSPNQSDNLSPVNERIYTMTFKELFDNFDKYQGRTVVFGRAITETELPFDEGMKAIISHIDNDEEATGKSYKVTFFTKSFLDYNRQYMRPDYYDKKGNPTLTAEQAGDFHDVETYYFDADDDIDKYFCILSAFVTETGILEDAVKLIKSYHETMPTPESTNFLLKLRMFGNNN